VRSEQSVIPSDMVHVLDSATAIERLDPVEMEELRIVLKGSLERYSTLSPSFVSAQEITTKVKVEEMRRSGQRTTTVRKTKGKD